MFGRGKRQKAQNLMQNGAKGVGTVVGVQDTGTTINDNPRVKMTFRVEPNGLLHRVRSFSSMRARTASHSSPFDSPAIARRARRSSSSASNAGT